jgi:hypothetical protein
LFFHEYGQIILNVLLIPPRNYEVSLLGNSLLVPNRPLLNVTNNSSDTEFGSLGLNAVQCNTTWNYAPKFLNVDYYNVGNGTVFEVCSSFSITLLDPAGFCEWGADDTLRWRHNSTTSHTTDPVVGW